MTYNIEVEGSDIRFDCASGTTILDAARTAGYELPYSCRTGICGSCKGRVVEGDIDAPAALEGITEEERRAGCTLLCQAKPISDVKIVPRSIAKIDPNAQKQVAAKLYRITRAADDISVLHLRFPAGTKVKFRAGQYLQVLLEDGSRRSFSMANPPHQNDGVLLHVRHVPNGRFSGYLDAGPATGDVVKLEMPFGDFHLREDSDKPIVFVASGTGFAPIRSILEDAFKRKLTNRPMTLYWGGRRSRDLYQAEVAQKWAQQYPNFRFVPVLSEPEEGWSGRTGFVHLAVLEDFPSLAGHEVYACGVPAMINAARRDFVGQAGLAAEDFHCDAFVTTDEAAQRAA
jgi:NAD(P)H-flavin reductase